jgi:hypothetical protein
MPPDAELSRHNLHMRAIGVKRALHCLTELAAASYGLRASLACSFPTPYQSLTDVGPVELWATR